MIYHYNSREDNGVFWQPESMNPWFESRAIHPTERVPCITVKTVCGVGWLLGDEVWDAFGLERMS